MFFLAMLALAVGGVAAKESTTAKPADPTISVFLPLGAGDYAASVVTAGPSSTVLAIGCQTTGVSTCPTRCPLGGETVTVTQGKSALAYTWTATSASIPSGKSTLVRDETKINCKLDGSTSATCTGASTVDNSAKSQTTTLALTNQSSIKVTLTAGATSAVMAGQVPGTPETSAGGNHALYTNAPQPSVNGAGAVGARAALAIGVVAFLGVAILV